MKKTFLLLTFLYTSLSFSQKVYYNQAVNSCSAKNDNDLIDKCIKNSYLLNYDFTTLNKETVSTSKIKKSIMLIATATWSAPCWGEIPAINEMVEKYSDKVEFIMIFWDKELDKIKKMAEKLDKRIKLVPAREEDKVATGNLDISGFVHKLDYPTIYLIDQEKKFVNVKRGAATPSKTMTWDQVNEINGKELEAFLAPVLK
ncbi:TlpA family protein disulfide reductase [Tenacibaculum sp. IB213877]|uniref:TlpA family protein disulfide reductase n=1 Tax=Tenacibaculum sp. IB213877 TaxID=3097351 RepID=UPI002A59A1CD|nr:redoxin domain-containing protein [Tenacibaculum sp. IB213877]MDY0779789.1 redoxin domain-containing protein [Tenacibaculum sp. IB213877]